MKSDELYGNRSLIDEKLELEIQELKRPVWRRPANLFGMIAAIVAVSGFVAQREFSRIHVERIELQAQRNLADADELKRVAERRAEEAERLKREADALRVDAVSESAAAIAEAQLAEQRADEAREEAERLAFEVNDLTKEREQKARQVKEAEARLEALENRFSELTAELAAQADPTETVREIENSIRRVQESIPVFECGAGTRFHCP